MVLRVRAPSGCSPFKTLIEHYDFDVKSVEATRETWKLAKLLLKVPFDIRKTLTGLLRFEVGIIEPTEDLLREITELKWKLHPYRGHEVRNAERDDIIVQLRDEKRPGRRPRSYGEIARILLTINPKWSRNGKPLPYETVKQAYHARKNRLCGLVRARKKRPKKSPSGLVRAI